MVETDERTGRQWKIQSFTAEYVIAEADIPATYARTLCAEDAYNVASPAIVGSAADIARVTGTTPGRNLTFAVPCIPAAVPIVIDECSVPLNVGDRFE